LGIVAQVVLPPPAIITSSLGPQGAKTLAIAFPFRSVTAVEVAGVPVGSGVNVRVSPGTGPMFALALAVRNQNWPVDVPASDDGVGPGVSKMGALEIWIALARELPPDATTTLWLLYGRKTYAVACPSAAVGSVDALVRTAGAWTVKLMDSPERGDEERGKRHGDPAGGIRAVCHHLVLHVPM